MSKQSHAAESTQQEARSRRPLQFRVIHLLIVMLIASIGLGIYAPIARRRAREDNIKNHLKHIAIALHNYHDVYAQFPPAIQCNASGQPIHSWRAAISDYMDSGPTARRVGYDFKQPWNGTANQAAAKEGAIYFRGPLAQNSSELTSYVAVVGPGTMWPGETSTKMTKVTDGLSNTMMIVAISNSDIHWMEPRDIPIEELDAWLDPQHKPRLGSDISGGFVAFADGSVEFLPRNLARERLRALLTSAGNEAVHRPGDDP